jgi:tRNA(Met) C34 N-acetyltransferase TmcA
MDEKEIKRLVGSFAEYVDYVWGNIGLPNATPLQKDICNTLQEGNRRLLIEAFRGVGKTYLTGAYATWRLLRNPNEKVLIVSASGTHATAISTFIHKLLGEVPLLEHLKPGVDQRNSVMAFDVSGCSATVQP